MLEELGRQLLGAFYSSLSQPETGRPQLRDHLFTTATCQHRCMCVRLCVHLQLSLPPSTTTHMLSHRHTNAVWYNDLPPSRKLMTVQVPCAHAAIRGVFMFPDKCERPLCDINLDKVERWASWHMCVYYEARRRPDATSTYSYPTTFIKED